VADTNWPPNFTLMYLELSYVCPKTWRCRKDELKTVGDWAEIRGGGGGGVSQEIGVVDLAAICPRVQCCMA